MSSPFILWTLQRTGGTNLFNLLCALSDHPSAEHEPFNFNLAQPRQFSKVYRDWLKFKDPAALHQICARRLLIKHVYEWFENDFNAALALAADRNQYRHIHLLRRDAVARLVSKGVAEAEGTWYPPDAETVFPKVIKGERRLKPLDIDYLVRKHEIAERKKLNVTRMHRKLMRCYAITYEDLYQGPIYLRFERLAALTDFLHIDRSRLDDQADLVEQYLVRGGQNTSLLLPHIPGINELRAALGEEGEVLA
jgi:hypothetical protein